MKISSFNLFVLGVFVPHVNFHSYGDVTIAGKGLKILTMLGIMAIEQFAFFSVQHVYLLLCDSTAVYNGQLRGPVTLMSIAERLAADLSLSILTK